MTCPPYVNLKNNLQQKFFKKLCRKLHITMQFFTFFWGLVKGCFALNFERRDFMYTDGYLKISRKILDWRWYKDSNTARLFFHLMLKANHTEAEFENHTIKRGQLVTSRKALAYELKMSEQSIRTALNHLKSTHDITITTTKKYSIITVLNYEELQMPTNTLTNNQQTSNKRATNN